MPSTKPVFVEHPVPFDTERLHFRPIRASDLPEFYVLRTDERIFKNFKSHSADASEEKTMEWMQRFMPPGSLETFSFAVEEKSNPGVAIGTIGCHHWPIMGYCFAFSTWGKGYATEALKGWLKQYWALERVEVADREGEEVLEAQTSTVNLASQKVLLKGGFVKGEIYVEEDTGEELVPFSMTRSKGEQL